MREPHRSIPGNSHGDPRAYSWPGKSRLAEELHTQQSPSRTPGEFLKNKKLHYRHIEKVFFEYSSSNMYPTTFNQIQIFQRLGVVQDHHIEIILCKYLIVYSLVVVL